MDNRSDFADADLHILTFEIPDDTLERAAGAPTLTMVNCTNPMLFQCPAIAANIAKLPGSFDKATLSCAVMFRKSADAPE